MKNTEYERIVAIIKGMATSGEEFTSDSVASAYYAYFPEPLENFRRVSHAIAQASKTGLIVKVGNRNNSNRKGGNMFVWCGVMKTEKESVCPSCKQRMPELERHIERDGNKLTAWG